MNQKLTFRALKASDWEEVAKIYQQGLDTGNATFETDVPDWDSWNSAHLDTCRLVAELNDTIVGWSALSLVSSRFVYRGVAEVSVYVSSQFSGQKIGTKLLKRLIEESETYGFWTLQASIFPENKASIVIHERLGFRQMGQRERIAQLNGIWRDTVILEKRSASVGIK